MRGNLLFLCQNLPYPPHGGARIRSYHTLRLLSAEYDVTGILFYRPSIDGPREAVQQGVEALSEFGRFDAFEIPQDGSRLRLLWDHARSVLGGRPYTKWLYDSGPARRRARRLIEEEPFRLVHLDSLDLAAFLPDLPDVPVVCAHHNVESQLLRRRAEAEKGLLRAYMRRQATLMEREERRLCGRFALNLVVSPEDERVLSKIAPDGRYLIVPNGVDTSAFEPAPEDHPREGIVFVGAHGWFPNRDGMEYFAESILPHIRAARPDVPVTWIGRADEQERKRFARHGIKMTGYVDDIRPLVHDAACFVVPLRVGGGTRLKILDAWSLGKAVVSTSPGCEGLEVVDGENMLVADDPEEFAAAVLRVLDSESLRSRLERRGRSTAEAVYDWGVIGETLLGAYREILAGSS